MFGISWSRLLRLLEMPLTIPRRLTIPVVEEEQWSKAFCRCQCHTCTSSSSAFVEHTMHILNGKFRSSSLLLPEACSGFLRLYTSVEELPRKFLVPWEMVQCSTPGDLKLLGAWTSRPAPFPRGAAAKRYAPQRGPKRQPGLITIYANFLILQAVQFFRTGVCH